LFDVCRIASRRSTSPRRPTPIVEVSKFTLLHWLQKKMADYKKRSKSACWCDRLSVGGMKSEVGFVCCPNESICAEAINEGINPLLSGQVRLSIGPNGSAGSAALSS